MASSIKRYFGILISILILLSVPLIVMQFTDEVNWTLGDFVVAGALLMGTALLTEFVLRKFKKSRFKVLLVVCILVFFLLTWIELAVGLF